MFRPTSNSFCNTHPPCHVHLLSVRVATHLLLFASSRSSLALPVLPMDSGDFDFSDSVRAGLYTAGHRAMGSFEQRERDPYSQRPVDDNWVLVWMNQYWFHTDYESIRFNLADKISYKGGDFHGHVEFVDSPYYGYEYMLLFFRRHHDCPPATMKFGKVVGTENWLHVDRNNWQNNCMLMPSEIQGHP